MKPIIALEGGLAYDHVFHEKSIVLNRTYTNAIAVNGGIPLLVTDISQVKNYAQIADALILTGSCAYSENEEEILTLFEQEKQRYPLSKALYKAFKEQGKPILGICLGIQSLNVYEGGTLKKNFKYDEGIEHMMCKHLIKISPSSFLYPLYGEQIMVNSRHNIRIDILGKDLIPTIYSLDGVIEGVRHKNLPIYGVQWHPERIRGDMREPPEGPDFDLFFKWFINQSKEL